MKPNVTTNRAPARPAAIAREEGPDPVALAAVVGDILAPLERLDALLEGDELERLPADTIGKLEEIRDDIEAAVAGYEPEEEEEE